MLWKGDVCWGGGWELEEGGEGNQGFLVYNVLWIKKLMKAINQC